LFTKNRRIVNTNKARTTLHGFLSTITFPVEIRREQFYTKVDRFS